jgi:hypothetical protein
LLVDVCFFHKEFTIWNLLGITLVVVPTAWVMSRRRATAQSDKSL